MDQKEFDNLKDLEYLDFTVSDYKKRAILFELAFAQYGFLIRDLVTVFTPDHIVPLPNAPRFIIGLTNYRNEILPVIDIRKKMDTATNTYSTNNSLIKVMFKDMPLAIFIENIISPVQYGNENITDVSESEAGGIPDDWILEGITIDDEKAFVLDLPTVLETLYDEVHYQGAGG